jgi:undecaprenyl diphosphate synthase
MIKKWLKFETIWDISKLPLESQKILKKIKEKTKNNTWLVLTIALIYWWQDEIIRATKKIIKAWLNPDEITKEKFREFLDTNFLPKVDLIIRTGWDIRHSGFLLFDSEYSEYYFTTKKWPEFDKNELEKAYDFFYNSKRNFWK